MKQPHLLSPEIQIHVLQIVHISGTPGSGKTTLGARIADLSADGVSIVDTDELITHQTSGGRELCGLKGGDRDVYARRWKQIFQQQLNDTISRERDRRTRLLVFVGVLDHFGPPGTILKFPEASQRFFIDIPLSRMVKQFYMRYSKVDNEFWKGVVSGKYTIPSSTEYLKSAERDREWHRTHGYQPMPPDDIYNRIIETIATLQ